MDHFPENKRALLLAISNQELLGFLITELDKANPGLRDRLKRTTQNAFEQAVQKQNETESHLVYAHLRDFVANLR